MPVFVDTSALLAFLNRDEPSHAATASVMRQLLIDGEILVTHNYVVVESTALIGQRFGLAMVQRLLSELIPALNIEWVDADLHDSAMAAMLVANRRQLGLVDCVSFAVMRRRGLSTALALDVHFAEQGFICLP